MFSREHPCGSRPRLKLRENALFFKLKQRDSDRFRGKPGPAHSPSYFAVNSIKNPFAPISGILLWVIAGAIYWFGKKKEKNHNFPLFRFTSERLQEANL